MTALYPGSAGYYLVAENGGDVLKRPEALPEGFDRIWRILADADESMHSRRRLAARLKVSTHTLQRILIDGDVPDLTAPQSAYVTGSWIRTITRIAAGLGLDAAELVRSAGVGIDAGVRRMIDSEMRRAGSGGPDGIQSAERQFSDLAGFILALLDPPASAGGAVGEARRQLQDSLRKYLVSTGATAPGLAGGSELESGAFCRSCMTSLLSEHNKGPSDRYCRWCSDAEGNLKTAEEVREVLTNWFMNWQSGITRDEAGRRVRHYMLAMPAWSDLEEKLESGA